MADPTPPPDWDELDEYDGPDVAEVTPLSLAERVADLEVKVKLLWQNKSFGA